MSTHEDPPGTSVPVDVVPPQTRRRVAAPPADRIVRQVEAIDAWNAARRMRESLLEAACTRLGREVAERQTDALLRTHQAIAARTAGDLVRDAGPLLFPTATAVIAHGHGWFAEKLAALLETRGVTVLECTDNGADALGAVVAEQPDVLLVEDRLAMMPGGVLLAETRLFAPDTVRAVQARDPQHSQAWLTRADVVFLRQHPPSDVADALSALCVAPAMEYDRV